MKTAPMLFVAMRNLFGRRASGGRDLARKSLRGAVLSVAASVVPLVVVLVVTDGMISGITDRYVELGTMHAQVVPRYGATHSALDEAAAAIESLEGVRGAWPEIQAVGVAFASGSRSGCAIRAVDPGFLDDRGTGEYLEVLAGEAKLAGPLDAVVGSVLASELGLEVGDTINLATVRGSANGFIPRVSIFRIRAIVSAGYRELDARWIFIPLAAGRRVLSPESSRSIIGVKFSSPDGDLGAKVEAVREVLSGSWSAYAWPELERNLYESFRTTRAILLLIVGLVVAVAAANVSSALVTLVTERSSEIAVLKSVGASNRDVSRIFVAGGVLAGGLGATMGLAVGLAVAVNVNALLRGIEALLGFLKNLALPGSERVTLLNPDYYLERIPIVVDPTALTAILAAALALSYVASLLPAAKAARLSPLEILRKH
ncbi:MAG: ABC transporter permease [Spirochaetales bacterium]|nr:ABC transporter permease [Spirochaetales bacterium]